jgi:phosphate acetyltransferase
MIGKLPEDDVLENVTFNELTPGRSAALTRTLSKEDIDLFAASSGDLNPAHMDEAYAKRHRFHDVIGHGLWSGALVSSVLGTVLPGPGTIYLEQNMKFRNPVKVGDQITATVTVREKRTDKPVVKFDCICTNQLGETVIEGEAIVLAPTEKIRQPRPRLPDVEILNHDHYHALIASCQDMNSLRTAVVHPVRPEIIRAVADAVQESLIAPVLIGPEARIKKAAEEAGIDISSWELVPTEHSHGAAARGVEMAAHGMVDAIMKGALHTDELMGMVVKSSSGLRTERRISHAFLMDIPTYHKPLIITDAAVNIAPTLSEKADICQNAICLWRVLFGTDPKPKVAILAAVETVMPQMPATIEAAALCKMGDRGQIEGGIIDGPLALDNAISAAAAADKGIISLVAGDADILVTPNIEAGNMVAKQLTFLGRADAAGIVLGARVPIMLTSRADSLRSRLMSCAIAVKIANARKKGLIK